MPCSTNTGAYGRKGLESNAPLMLHPGYKARAARKPEIDVRLPAPGALVDMAASVALAPFDQLRKPMRFWRTSIRVRKYAGRQARHRHRADAPSETVRDSRAGRSRRPASGGDTTLTLYPGATHDFDAPDRKCQRIAAW